MRALVPVLLSLLLAIALPAQAQDLLSSESKSESTADVLQKLLLGKVKEKGATTGGTKAGTATTTDRLPRKAAGTGTTTATSPDKDMAGKPARLIKPRPTRQASSSTMPRLRPAAPISASPTIQPPKPIPMPAAP